MALLEKAAGQGHAYAMETLAGIHTNSKEHDQAVAWHTKGADAGLPIATSGSASTRGWAWRRRTTQRRWTGTGARQMLVTELRRTISAPCTRSAVAGPSG